MQEPAMMCTAFIESLAEERTGVRRDYHEDLSRKRQTKKEAPRAIRSGPRGKRKVQNEATY
jgi:hypothetical protein